MQGIRYKVISNETVNPPIMVIASGIHNSDPMLLLKSIGIIARMVVSDVISTGRNLDLPASRAAVVIDHPRALSRLV